LEKRLALAVTIQIPKYPDTKTAKHPTSLTPALVLGYQQVTIDQAA
jgi:hypothetical protein